MSLRGAKHPQGVRRIRKAAKLPTAAQPVTEGFRTPVVPLIRHGLRPCHLLPCGGKAIAVPSEALKCRWRSPHPSRLAPCHLPPGEGFLFLTPGAGAGADMIRPPSAYKASIAGGWGHPPLRNVTNLVRRGRCPQRPAVGVCTHSIPVQQPPLSKGGGTAQP